MELQLLKYWSRKIVLIVVLFVAPSLVAAPHVRHALNVSLAGGTILILPGAEAVEGLRVAPGADANAGVGYEVSTNRIFFNVGAEVDFDYGRMRIKDFADQLSYSCTQPAEYAGLMGATTEQMEYSIYYTDYLETDNELQVAVPVQLGVYVTDVIYVAAGMKVVLGLMNNYDVKTTLYTGAKTDFMQPGGLLGTNHMDELQTAAAAYYGVYQPSEFRFSDSQAHRNYRSQHYAMSTMLAPNVEVGARLPLGEHSPHNVRIGAYIEYGIPLRKGEAGEKLVDYSQMSLDTSRPAGERTAESGLCEANMRNTIAAAPIKDTRFVGRGFSTLSIGLRVTFNLDVTVRKKICHCLD